MTDLRIPNLGPRRLEVGCGSRARAAKGARSYLGIDVVQDYLEQAHRKYPRQTFLLGRAQDLLPLIEPNTFDGAYLVDVLEHIPKREGRQLLREAERVAKAVAVFAPVGDMPQSPKRGMLPDDPPSQQHRSSWSPSDFDGGWKIKVLRRFHQTLRNGEELPQPLDAFWAIRS